MSFSSFFPPADGDDPPKAGSFNYRDFPVLRLFHVGTFGLYSAYIQPCGDQIIVVVFAVPVRGDTPGAGVDYILLTTNLLPAEVENCHLDLRVPATSNATLVLSLPAIKGWDSLLSHFV